MVDEPEMGVCFQYRMSLKNRTGRSAMLRKNDNPHGELGTAGFGRDGGFC